jgi:hypothetical protein
MNEVSDNNNQNQEPELDPSEITPKDYDIWDPWDPWGHSIGFHISSNDQDELDLVCEDDLRADNTQNQ